MPLGRLLAAIYSLDLWTQYGRKLSFHRAKSSGPKNFPKFWALSIYFLCIRFIFNYFPRIILAPLLFLYHIRSPILYDPTAVGNSGSALVFIIFLFLYWPFSVFIGIEQCDVVYLFWCDYLIVWWYFRHYRFIRLLVIL